MSDPLTFQCPYLAIDIIHDNVKTFCDIYPNCIELPIDIENIIERAGLNIVPTPGLRDIDIDAYLSINANDIYVDLDTYMDERFNNRLRFSFAHEIGHYVLHRDIISQMHYNNSDEYNDYITNFPDNEY